MCCQINLVKCLFQNFKLINIESHLMSRINPQCFYSSCFVRIVDA